MTIQVPNPGTGNGATGDNEFVLWSKVKANFEDQTNVASRLVGTADGQIAAAEDTFKASFQKLGKYYSASQPVNCNSLDAGTSALVAKTADNNTPPTAGNSIIYTLAAHPSAALKMQLGFDYVGTNAYIRHNNTDLNTWSAWTPLSNNSQNYTQTTAAGANVVVDTTGRLLRSTSSERYKDIIADLELDDTAYENAMQLAPIVYRSTAEADNPNYHYYSFSAEALGEYDPAFTLWRNTETVTDDEGNTSEQPLDERQAEGINLNAIVAFLHATNVKQGKLITEQAEAIETLTKRIDDITVE